MNPTVALETTSGILRVKVAPVNGEFLLLAMSSIIPEVPVVRFQSSCVFGEAFDAIDCDCGAQLRSALALIGGSGGILVYAWEEGRGAGIIDKVRAISLQQGNGLSTVDAFEALGHAADLRTYASHIAALRQVFTGTRIRLASSNPKKIAALEAAGYNVERVKLEIKMTPQRIEYLRHKRAHLGHLSDD